MNNRRIPVIFIHGTGFHFSSWQPWMDRFSEFGYDPFAPEWPGESETVSMTRANPTAVGGIGLARATDHFARMISSLPHPPIVVGHGVGGLIAQKLHSPGITRATIAVASFAPAGLPAPASELVRTGLDLVGKPWTWRGTSWPTRKKFRSAIGNAVSAEEAEELFERLVVPSPTRPSIELFLSNAVRNPPTRVDFGHGDNRPLLLVAGTLDRTVPIAVVRANQAAYADAGTAADLFVCDGRGHSMAVDSGWGDVADRCLRWLSANGLKPDTGLGSRSRA